MTATPAALLQAIQASQVALHPAGDGALEARMDTLELRQLALETPFGGVRLPKAVLRNARLQLAAGLALQALRADALEADSAELVPAPPVSPRAGAAPAEPLRLEPLGTLQGRVEVCIRDARWTLDAQITVPIVAGRIDFDRVVVEHVGPNSWMGVAPSGIYVEAPDRGRTELVRFERPGLPGVRYEQRGGFMDMQVSDRGSLDLRAFVEALLNAAGSVPVGRPAGGDMGVLLARTRLSGDVQLADGALGNARAGLTLAGRSEGRNGVALSAAVLGQRLVVRIPQLAASGASFEWQGRRGTAGTVSGAVELHVTGLADPVPGLAATLSRLVARDIAVA